MIATPSSSSAVVVALGLVVGLAPSIQWNPVKPHEWGAVHLPAASQYMVAAEARRADTVLDNRTSEEEAPSVDGWLRRLPSGGHGSALRVILNHPAPVLRQRWVKVLFSRWAADGRQEAMRAALEIESPSLRLVALDAVLDDWSRRDARSAWSYVLSVPDPMVRSHLIGHMLDAQAGSEPQATVAWATSLADPFLRSKALDQIAKAWVRRDVRRCVDWALDLEDPLARRAVLGHAVANLGRQDPVRAFDTALAEPDAVSRRELMTIAFQNVTFTRLNAALSWLRANQSKLDITYQPTMRVLGATLANDENQTKQLPQLARSLGSKPLSDSLLAGAALRLVAQGADFQAKVLLVGIGPGIEREEVKAALNRR